MRLTPAKALSWMICAYLCSSVAYAELTAVVSPGYTFNSTERPTYSTLNRLGLPTITIVGTLDGTNAGISAGSINANMFANSVVDSLTIDYTNSSPQALRIKAAGVGVRELSSAVAGPGLTGGSGYALTNNVDGQTLLITNDVVTLGTNAPSFITVASNSVVVGTTNNQGLAMNPLQFATNVFPGLTFTATSVALSAGSMYNAAHSLGVTPGYVRWVLVMGSTTELGYSIGDEVDLNNASQTTLNPKFSFGANTTNVWLTLDNTSNINIGNKTNGARELITPSRWTAKCYVRP